LPGLRGGQQNHPLSEKSCSQKTGRKEPWQQKARADRPGFR
jgi:hypothetical protein